MGPYVVLRCWVSGAAAVSVINELDILGGGKFEMQGDLSTSYQTSINIISTPQWHRCCHSCIFSSWSRRSSFLSAQMPKRTRPKRRHCNCNISVRVRGCTLITSTVWQADFWFRQVPLLPVYHCPPECPWLFERAFLYTGSLTRKVRLSWLSSYWLRSASLNRCNSIINPGIYILTSRHATGSCHKTMLPR